MTTATTQVPLKDPHLMMLPTGLDLKVTSAHLMLTTPRSGVLSMLKVSGESFFNIFQENMDTDRYLNSIIAFVTYNII